MKQEMFSIYYHKYSVNNWQEKKSEIKEWLNKRTLVRRDTGLIQFYTDRFSETSDEDKFNFCQIIREELNMFSKEIETNQLIVQDIWSVQYTKGDFHAPHDHGSCNYSLVLYVDYDEQEHTPTQFVCPYKDATKNVTFISADNSTKEGDIVIFPSNILHLTLPNKSDKIRTVVSMDIVTVGTQHPHNKH